MSNISYEPSHKEENITTGNLLYISESVYDGDWLSYPHRHFGTEIFCINSGSGEFSIEGKRFKAEAGDIVIINSNLQHTEYSANNIPLNYYVIGIDDVDFIFEEAGENNPIIKSKELFRDVQVVMGNMIVEMKNQDLNYNYICKKMADILVLILLRQKEIQISLQTSQNISKETLTAKKYLDRFFAMEINLDILAKESHLSKFYLARRFSEELGTSPMQYLTEKRLQAAEQLLNYTNLSIGEISDSVGFSSQSYFAQVYKKRKNISPAEYRKAHN